MQETTADIAISGARGQIGRFAVLHARKRGLRVLAISRKGAPVSGEDDVNLLWCKPDALATQQASRLIHAAPLELLPAFADALGATRIVAFSSTSIQTKAGTARGDEARMLATLRQGEQAARQLAARCESLILIRPTMVYGAGLDATVSWLYRRIQGGGLIPLPMSGSGLRQPVHAEDLACAALNACIEEPNGFNVFSMGGGERLKLDAIIRVLARVQGREARLLRLPTFILTILMSSLRLLPRFRQISPSLISRMMRDQVVDNREAIAALKVEPRPFNPKPADFELPPWCLDPVHQGS